MALEYVTTDRGRQKLILDNYLYAHDRLCVDGREMWRCDRRNECKARIHTMNGFIIQRINEHTHPPDTDRIDQIRASDWIIQQKRPTGSSEITVGPEIEIDPCTVATTSKDEPNSPHVTDLTVAAETTAALMFSTGRRRRRHANSVAVFPPIGIGQNVNAGFRSPSEGPPSKIGAGIQSALFQAFPSSSSPPGILSPSSVDGSEKSQSDSQTATGLKQESRESSSSEERMEISKGLPIPNELAIQMLSQKSVVARCKPDDQLIFKEPSKFWGSVYDLGVFDDLYQEVQNQMELMRRAFVSRPDVRTEVAQKLSEIVKLLECGSKVNNALNNKRMLTQAETQMLSNEIEELKRKTEERRQKQLEIQKKAEMFSQLFGQTPSLHQNNSQQNSATSSSRKASTSSKIFDGLLHSAELLANSGTIPNGGKSDMQISSDQPSSPSVSPTEAPSSSVDI